LSINPYYSENFYQAFKADKSLRMMFPNLWYPDGVEICDVLK